MAFTRYSVIEALFVAVVLTIILYFSLRSQLTTPDANAAKRHMIWATIVSIPFLAAALILLNGPFILGQMNKSAVVVPMTA